MKERKKEKKKKQQQQQNKKNKNKKRREKKKKKEMQRKREEKWYRTLADFPQQSFTTEAAVDRDITLHILRTALKRYQLLKYACQENTC